MRLIYPNMAAAEHTKASVAARRIADIWRETTADNGGVPMTKRVPTATRSQTQTGWLSNVQMAVWRMKI